MTAWQSLSRTTWLAEEVGMPCPASGIGFTHGWESIELMFPASSENRVAILDWNRFAGDFETLAGASAEQMQFQ